MMDLRVLVVPNGVQTFAGAMGAVGAVLGYWRTEASASEEPRQARISVWLTAAGRDVLMSWMTGHRVFIAPKGIPIAVLGMEEESVAPLILTAGSHVRSRRGTLHKLACVTGVAFAASLYSTTTALCAVEVLLLVLKPVSNMVEAGVALLDWMMVLGVAVRKFRQLIVALGMEAATAVLGNKRTGALARIPGLKADFA